jgi:benzoate membrane transport protein
MSQSRLADWVSLSAHALAIFIVGFASTVLIVMDAVRAVGATPAQQASAIAALCLAQAATSLYLGVRYRQPIIVAWSTPGAALLASSHATSNFAEATAAFLCAGLLMIVTAFAKPLANAISKLPASIAGAMLAGVLLHYVLAVPGAAVASPVIVLPLAVVFFMLRHVAPLYATPVVVALALAVAAATGAFNSPISVSMTQPQFVVPVLNWQTVMSIGIPLYLVTMASQNLPGFAVLKSNGYEPPVQGSIFVTGLASMFASFFGAHAVNMAAITAAMAVGPDVHSDPNQRWKVIIPYAVIYVCAGLVAATFVTVLGMLPAALVATVAGLALLSPFLSGLVAMVKDAKDIEAAAVTFLVTGSGVTLLGVGAAFWGLLTGLLIWGLKQVWRAR